MTDIVYQGLTFTQTPSGDWRVDTNFGSATGSTPAQAILNASNSIAANNPNSASIQTYADGIKGIALDPATNGGVSTAYRAADKPTSTVTAADAVTTTTPPSDTGNVAAANSEPLSTTEQQNIDNQATGAGTTDYGTAITDKLQSEADAEYGSGNVTVGPATVVPEAETKNPDAVTYKPLPNVLHQYAGYTYGLSLHLLTKDEYNDVILKQKFVPNRVLIASAGKYNNTPGPTQFIRSPYFSNDFYFDKLTLETVIGMNERTRETNGIKFDFTLIEPYGFTLINNLIDQCNDPTVDSKNYLDMPYLLQIDFYAMNDAGEIVGLVPDITKKIPIRILKMDIKVGVKGAEYVIEASAYNHCAFDHSYADVPVNFEVEARTVAQFFQSTETQTDPTDTSSQRETTTKISATIIGPDGQYTPVNPSLVSPQMIREVELVKSFGSAMNEHTKDQKTKNKIGANDRYFFRFDPNIGNSQFTVDKLLSPKDTGMIDPDKPVSIAKANMGRSTADYDPTLRIFQINAGTTVDRILSYVVQMSDFIQKQVNIPDGENPEAYLRRKAETSDTPLYWFKIIPVIKLGEFDKIRKVWQRDITFYVQSYEIRSIKLRDIGPGGKVEKPVKEYNYIYTGKNVDVFDFDIQFNALAYNAMTMYRDALADVYNLPVYTEDNKSSNPDTYTGIDSNNNNIVPMILKTQVIDARNRTGSAAVTAKQVAVADLAQSLHSMYGADMLGLKLRILGDPQFIKQDDIFYPPKIGEAGTWDPRLVSPNGSLSMDTGEVYVLVNFRTPEDVDDQTGLMKFGKNSSSLFSGMYKVLVVTSEFSQGQFTQTLEMVRVPHQDKYDYSANAPKATTTQRTTESTQPDTPAVEAPQTQTSTGTTADNSDTTTQTATEPATEAATTTDQNLADVAANAEEQPITSATEPQAVVTPPPSAPTAAQTELQSQISNLESLISSRQASIASHQAIITKADSRVAAGTMTAENAAALVRSEQSAIDTLNAMISENQSQLATLKSQLTGIGT